MQFQKALRALVFAAVSVSADTPAAPALSSLPSCALQPTVAALGSTGCATTDYKCICENSQFLATLTPVIESSCNAADLQATLTFATALCASVGVTLAIPGVPSSSVVASISTTAPAITLAGSTAAASTAAATTAAQSVTSSSPAAATSSSISYSTTYSNSTSGAASSVAGTGSYSAPSLSPIGYAPISGAPGMTGRLSTTLELAVFTTAAVILVQGYFGYFGFSG